MLRVCFNCYGNYTTDTVYQWDQNHELLIQGISVRGNAPTVQFCNKKSNTAIVVQSTETDEGILVPIPNQLLEEPYDIIAYVHTYANNNAKTIETVNIPLVKRVKPDEYQFTENIEIMTFERLESDMVNFINLITGRITEYKTNMDITLQACRDAISALQFEMVNMDGGTPTTEEELYDNNYNGGYPVDN